MLAPERDDETKDHGGRPPRKPYSPPKLVVHGRIEEITAAGGLTNSDGVLGSSLA